MRIIAGKWRSRIIEAPPGKDTRPTTDRVREAWMSMLQPDIPESRVLDLFAGSGALGLEALSRGARHVTFVEKAAPALRVLTANIDALQAAQDAEVAKMDVFKFLDGVEPLSFDLALADPPYGSGAALKLILLFMAKPFAQVLSVEHAAKEKLPESEAVSTRRYGDTAITSVLAPS